MSKEIPILFSTPMVQAILGGTKTMTRRVVKTRHSGIKGDGKLHIENAAAKKWEVSADPIPKWAGFNGNTMATSWRKCPYGKPGDVLWVREKWCHNPSRMTGPPIFYYANGDHGFNYPDNERWKPSIHMKKDYARIWLEVVNVKVENLQDVSDGDVAREGVTWNEPLQIGRDERNCKSPAQRAFRTLWDKINGVKSWDENPWCWCVSFKVLSTTGKNIVSENGK